MAFSTLESGLRSETQQLPRHRTRRQSLSVPSNRAYEVKQDVLLADQYHYVLFQYPRIGPTK